MPASAINSAISSCQSHATQNGITPEHAGALGVLILSQNGLLHDRQTSAMGMSLAAVAARALMTGFGYNVEQALRTLEAWSAEYSREVSSGSNRDSGA